MSCKLACINSLILLKIYHEYLCVTRWGFTWWRHQKKTFSALLALCAENSPITGEFPSQMPVTQSFDVFFDLRLNKRLSKQSRSWLFETPSCPLWHHCNELENCVSPVTTGSDKDLLGVLKQTIPQYGNSCLHPRKMRDYESWMSSHYLDHCWFHWTVRSNHQWNFDRNAQYWTFCPGLHWLSLILWDSSH